MANALINLWRLARAGVVLAQHGVRGVPKGQKVPLLLKLARAATIPIQVIAWPFNLGTPKARRISSALAELGPSYIKLGQFLATRADVIGPEIANDLSYLQDRMPAFSMKEARRAIEETLGGSFHRTSPQSGCDRKRRTQRSRGQNTAAEC